MASDQQTTSFGFKTIKKEEKETKVKEVFESVARSYDVMNDAMSAGVHRLWKNSLIDSLRPKDHMRHLDVAGGTGDIAFRALGVAPGMQVTVCDINAEMLKVGKARASEKVPGSAIDFVCGNAEHLPMENNSFDSYTIAFGIRNVTNIDKALSEAFRVLKPGGRFLCLEFSPAVTPFLKPLYDAYSFKVIPVLGDLLAKDRDSYQYLVESIRQFPGPDHFADMIKTAGFEKVSWRGMSNGIVALHSGWRL